MPQSDFLLGEICKDFQDQSLLNSFSLYKRFYPNAQVQILGALPWLLLKKTNTHLSDLNQQRIDFCIKKIKKTICIETKECIELPLEVQQNFQLRVETNESSKKIYKGKNQEWVLINFKNEYSVHHNLNVQCIVESNGSESQLRFYTPKIFKDSEINKNEFLINKDLFRINENGKAEFYSSNPAFIKTTAAVIRTLLLSLFTGMQLAPCTQDFLNALEQTPSSNGNPSQTFLDEVIVCFFDKYYSEADDDIRFIYDYCLTKINVNDGVIKWSGTTLFNRAKSLNNRITQKNIISQECLELIKPKSIQTTEPINNTTQIDVAASKRSDALSADKQSESSESKQDNDAATENLSLPEESTGKESQRDNDTASLGSSISEQSKAKETPKSRRRKAKKTNVEKLEESYQEPFSSSSHKEFFIEYPTEEQIENWRGRINHLLKETQQEFHGLENDHLKFDKLNRFKSSLANLMLTLNTIFKNQTEQKSNVIKFESDASHLFGTIYKFKKAIVKAKENHHYEKKPKVKIKESNSHESSSSEDDEENATGVVVEKRDVSIPKEKDNKEARYNELVKIAQQYYRLICKMQENDLLRAYKKYHNEIEPRISPMDTKKEINSKIRGLLQQVNRLANDYRDNKLKLKNAKPLSQAIAPLPADIIKKHHTDNFDYICLIAVAATCSFLINEAVAQYEWPRHYLHGMKQFAPPEFPPVLAMLSSVMGSFLCNTNRLNPDQIWMRMSIMMRYSGVICGLLCVWNQILKSPWPNVDITNPLTYPYIFLYASARVPNIGLWFFAMIAILNGILGVYDMPKPQVLNQTPKPLKEIVIHPS